MGVGRRNRGVVVVGKVGMGVEGGTREEVGGAFVASWLLKKKTVVKPPAAPSRRSRAESGSHPTLWPQKLLAPQSLPLCFDAL